jgi:membrane protein involved in colicin uptake
MGNREEIVLKKTVLFVGIFVFSGAYLLQFSEVEAQQTETKETEEEKAKLEAEEAERLRKMSPQMRKKQLRIRSQKECEEKGIKASDSMALRNCMKESIGEFREELDSSEDEK